MDASRPDPAVLFLLVGYHNLPDVRTFIDRVKSHSPHVAFSVCDNSETGLTPNMGDGVVVSRRSDNPGYLDGGLTAWREYVRLNPARTMPSWIVLSNTDLDIRGEEVECVLSDHDPAVPVVLAPRITEGTRQLEKNPHQMERRSRTRLRVNHWVTLTPSMALGYVVLAALRVRRRERRTTSTPELTAQPGTRMYAPYGAVMAFSRAFMTEVGLPDGVPLLAEEFAVAERARIARAPVLFEPRLHFHHEPHTTTGPRVTRRRSRMLSRAFRYIDEVGRAGSPRSRSLVRR